MEKELKPYETFDTAILWESSCNDLYGAMVFNRDESPINWALNIFSEGLNIDFGDRIEIIDCEGDDVQFDHALAYIGDDLLNKATEYAFRAGSFYKGSH